MPRKKRRETPARNCTCDKCQTTAHAIPGSKHRRCPGSEGKNIRAKHSPTGNRGFWQ